MDGQEAIVIASAARTPVGSFNGTLSTVPAHDLGKAVIIEALARANVDGGEVSEVIMGQILAAGQGQNPARQAAINASLPIETTAMGINFLCGSGLRSVAMASQAIRLGDSDIVVAGGQESMSLAPHCQYLRQGVRMGHFEMLDTMDQRWTHGRLQWVPYGRNRRERGAAMADHAGAAGRTFRGITEQGFGRETGRPLQG